MKHVFGVVLCLAVIFSSCGSNSSKSDDIKPKEVVSANKEVVTLALMPIVDCLPYYYAEERGFFERFGVSVKIVTYKSKLDCDTAIVGRSALMGYSDLFHAMMMSEGRKVSVVNSTQGGWSLLVNKSLRIKKTSQLSYKTTAIARFSTEAYLLSSIPKTDEVLLPQVNDLYLRTSMVDNNQVDAAMLPEPFATQCRMRGHKAIWTAVSANNFGCMLTADKVKGAEEEKKIIAITKAYNMAVDSLNARNNMRENLSGILAKWGMQEFPVDSLHVPTYSHAASFKKEDIAAVYQFLRTRNCRFRSSGVLVNDRFCKKAETH